MSSEPDGELGLEAVLGRLPPAPILFVLGLGITGAGLWLALTSTSLLVKLAGLPVLSTGVAALAFGALKTRSAQRLERLQRQALEASSSEHAEQVAELLADGAPRAVLQITEALDLSKDEAVRALASPACVVCRLLTSSPRA